MAEVNKYVVLVDNSLAKDGRFLPKGTVIELEDRLAHTEFAGRVALESDPTKPTIRWEESTAALGEFDRQLKQAGLRSHEKVQLLETRKTALTRQLSEVDRLLETAKKDLEADTARIQERHARLAARQTEQPAAQPETPAPPAEPSPAQE